MFQWCFEVVLRKFQGRFRGVTWMFQVTRKIEECFEGVLRVIQGSFKEEEVSRMC